MEKYQNVKFLHFFASLSPVARINCKRKFHETYVATYVSIILNKVCDKFNKSIRIAKMWLGVLSKD